MEIGIRRIFAIEKKVIDCYSTQNTLISIVLTTPSNNSNLILMALLQAEHGGPWFIENNGKEKKLNYMYINF